MRPGYRSRKRAMGASGRNELSRGFEALCRQMGHETIERDDKAGRFDQWIEGANAQGAVTASERLRGLFRVLRAATSPSNSKYRLTFGCIWV